MKEQVIGYKILEGEEDSERCSFEQNSIPSSLQTLSFDQSSLLRVGNDLLQNNRGLFSIPLLNIGNKLTISQIHLNRLNSKLKGSRGYEILSTETLMFHSYINLVWSEFRFKLGDFNSCTSAAFSEWKAYHVFTTRVTLFMNGLRTCVNSVEKNILCKFWLQEGRRRRRFPFFQALRKFIIYAFCFIEERFRGG